MIVDGPLGKKGLSVFVVDPGQTSGWAWACIGRSEVARHGIEESLSRASRHRSGLQAADRRFLTGQVPVHYSGGLELIGVDEWQAAEMLVAALQMCGEMGSSASGKAVPQITDVVIEDFVLRQRTMTRDLLSPVRLTAAFQALLCQHPWRMRMHLQQSQVMATIADKTLKDNGLWSKEGEHARDATRHLLVFLRSNARLIAQR